MRRKLNLQEHDMNPFSAFNLPMTMVIVLLVWAWLSFFSVAIGSLL